MFRIEENPNYPFRIYQPAVEEYDQQMKRRAEWEKANTGFLATQPGCKPEELSPVTGTFIYAHAPDYRANTLEWNRTQWLERLKALKDRGIDTVIFQAAAWKELRECYYPGKIHAGYKCWDVLTPAMEAANALELTFFMGEFGAVENWQGKQNGTRESMQQELDEHCRCLEELFTLYDGGFQGIYLTSESGYTGKRDAEFEDAAATFYGELCGMIRSAQPGKPILISPFSFDCGNKLEEMADYWQTVFSRAVPDILAPQDSIGTLCVTLDRQWKIYEQWRKTAAALGCTHWSNIELFEVNFPKAGNTRLTTAPEKRIMAQLQAARGIQKCICWEMLSFL